MKLHVVLADPAGNRTALVEERAVKESSKREISRRLLEDASLAIEQVGYFRMEGAGSPAHLEMMGGEFCGNAARSFGLFLAKKCGMQNGYLSITVSGSKEPLKVQVSGDDASIFLPTQHAFSNLSILGQEPLPVVELPGISHIIAQGVEACQKNLTPILQAAREQLCAPAVGVLFYDANARFLRPAVAVWEQGSVVFENSCGSGSLALALHLKREMQSGGCAMSIEQPGGRIRVVLQKLNGALLSCKIGGPVALETREIEIEDAQ